MAQARFVGDFTPANNSITNAHVNAAADFETSKMRHSHRMGTNFDLAIGATPVAREEIVFVAHSAGTIKDFAVLLNDTGTSTDVDFDLKVNGVSVLSAVVNVTNADGDGLVKNGTINSASLVADDIVSIELIVTSSTGAQGPFAVVSIEENTAP